MHAVLRLAVACSMLHPAGYHAPEQSVQEPIRRAQSVLAFALDPALPAIPLEAWVRHIVGSSARYQWASGACAGARGSHTAALPVCAVVVASTREVVVTISVRLGEFIEDPTSRSWEGSHQWDAPRFDDAFIDRGKDSLTLERLSDLPRVLAVPPEQWPARDVGLEQDAVRCSPAEPMPRDEVECSVVVSNLAETTGYARVFMDVQPDGNLDAAGLVKLPARGRKTVKITLSWPEEEGGSVSFGVELLRRTPYHAVGENGELRLAVRSERETLANLREQLPGGEPQTILSARGTLSGASHSFDVPVDSSISRLVVSVELQRGLAATLVRPSGPAVNQSDSDAVLGTVKQVEVGRKAVENRQVFTVTAPEPGLWRVDLSDTGTAGASRFAVVARGNSPIAFGTFEFVRKQVLVHRGYFPIEGMPLAGAPAIGRARVQEIPAGAAFRTVDETGATLQAIVLHEDDPDSLPYEPVGMLELPAVPFSIVLDATDASGAPIRRQYPVVFRAQTVCVSFDFDGLISPTTSCNTAGDGGERDLAMMALTRSSWEIVAGSSRQLRFVVTNLGTATADFALNVRTNLGEVRGLSPQIVAVEPGASGVGTFSLAIPADASPGDHIELRMTARNTADPALRNSATVEFEVAPQK